MFAQFVNIIAQNMTIGSRPRLDLGAPSPAACLPPPPCPATKIVCLAKWFVIYDFTRISPAYLTGMLERLGRLSPNYVSISFALYAPISV